MNLRALQRLLSHPFAGRCALALLLLAAALLPVATRADATSTIQAQIDAHNAQISALQQQIAGYQTQLDTLGAQHQTLQSAISSIDVTRQQTSAQISVTQNKIAASNLKLQELSGQITQKQYDIDLDKQTLAQSVRAVQLADDASLPEQIFSSDSLADAWTAIDADNSLNGALEQNAQSLQSATAALADQQDAVVQTKTSLSSLNSNLTSQQQQLDANKAAKAALLAQTQSQESTYQTLIAQKQAQEASFEAELANLQAGLTSVGSASVPAAGAGILSWPFSASVMATCPGKAAALGAPDCITQYFGNTDFSTANPQIYNGMGHDGLDIGVPIGTPVLAALSGTVLATGDTDITAPDGEMCYSFGKWVMLQHANGLDTLYAHLSNNTIVSKGEAVTTGEEIGLSGMTGYATGPHLHLGVYASAGVQIMDLGSFRAESASAPAADVTELQKLLTTLGDYSGAVSGNYDSSTVTAVDKFQASQGIEQVGSVGPATRAALNTIEKTSKGDGFVFANALSQNTGSTSDTPCTAAGAVLPVAPTNAYLNPLSYLPAS